MTAVKLTLAYFGPVAHAVPPHVPSRALIPSSMAQHVTPRRNLACPDPTPLRRVSTIRLATGLANPYVSPSYIGLDTRFESLQRILVTLRAQR